MCSSTSQWGEELTCDSRLAWIWAELFRQTKWERGVERMRVRGRKEWVVGKNQPPMGQQPDNYPLYMCRCACSITNQFFMLLIDCFPGHWIKQRTDLTSSVSAYRVNSAHGYEIKGTSRHPFFHILTILEGGGQLIPTNLIKDMWETRPYVEEISVEFWPFLDFLSSDNRCRVHTYPQAHKHKQFPNLLLFFLETQKQWTLSTPSIELGLLRPKRSHAHTLAHLLTCFMLLSLAPHLAHLRCTTLRSAWFSSSAPSVHNRSSLITSTSQ